MDVERNHLVAPEVYENMSEEEKEKYEKIPNELSLAAKLELMGEKEAFIGEESSGSIAKFARLKRKMKRRKANKLYCK